MVEIGILASTIEGMRRALRSYATISEETRIAEAIMRGTLSADLPRPEGFEIEALRRPADETGGEVFDVALRLGREREDTALLLLDPNGFGVEAAVLSAQLRAVFRAAVRTGTALDEVARQLGALPGRRPQGRRHGPCLAGLPRPRPGAHRLARSGPGRPTRCT